MTLRDYKMIANLFRRLRKNASEIERNYLEFVISEFISEAKAQTSSFNEKKFREEIEK